MIVRAIATRAALMRLSIPHHLPRRDLHRPPRRRPCPKAVRSEHRPTEELRPPCARLDVRQMQPVALTRLPRHDQPDPRPVIRPLADHRLLERLGTAAGVEEGDGEGRGEEGAAAGEAHSMIWSARTSTEGEI